MEKIKVSGKKLKDIESEIREYLKSKELDKHYEVFRVINNALTGEEVISKATGEYQIIVGVYNGTHEGYFIFISTVNMSYKLTDWFILRFHIDNIDDVLIVQNELIKVLEI